MTTVTTPSPVGPESPDFLKAKLTLSRKAADLGARIAMVGSFIIAALPLAFIIGYVVVRSWDVISLTFLTDPIPGAYGAEGGGMGPAVVGTLLITGMAALLAIPLGIAGAVYLNEYGKQKPFARLVRFLTDVMSGVPSVVMGIFILTIWVLRFGERTGFAGALALACLMLPIVIRSTEEMLRLVPDELRQASLALGARPWKTTMTVVMPTAAPGVVSGSMLAIARAAGETAPIVLVTGLVLDTNWNLFEGQNTTLAAQIFRNASRSQAPAQDRAFGAALALIVLVFVFTFAARWLSNRFSTIERT